MNGIERGEVVYLVSGVCCDVLFDVTLNFIVTFVLYFVVMLLI